MKYTLILFLGTLLFTKVGAQEGNVIPWKNDEEKRQIFYEAALRDFKLMKVKLNLPKHFNVFMKGISRFPIPSGTFEEGYGYSLINKDSSVVICFALFPNDEKKNTERNTSMGILRPDWKNYNADSTWIYHMRTSADTVNGGIRYYKARELEKSNSDNSSEYLRPEKELFINKYHIYKTVTIHKKNRGFISISYFNTNKTTYDAVLEKIIKNNRRIVTFLDD